MNGDVIDQIGSYLTGKSDLPKDVDETAQVLLIAIKSERNERANQIDEMQRSLTLGIDAVYSEVGKNTEAIRAIDETIHGSKEHPETGLVSRIRKIDKCLNSLRRIALWIGSIFGAALLAGIAKVIIDYLVNL